LLFGVHPMTVEPLAWIAERGTLLATAFALMALIVYTAHARRPRWYMLTGCGVAYILALMCKPTIIALPGVLLLMDFWPLGRLSRRAVLEKIPIFAMGGIFMIITILSRMAHDNVSLPTEYSPLRVPLIFCYDMIFYLYKIVRPVGLSTFYPFPEPMGLADPMVRAGLIGTGLLVPVLLIALRWTRAPLAGWLIFVVAILPTVQIIGFSHTIAADKYVYFPAAGLLMILAWLMNRLWTATINVPCAMIARTAAVCVLLILAGAESLLTRQQIARWQTTEGYYRYMVELAPNDPKLLNTAGGYLADQGKLPEAADLCRRAIKFDADYAPGYVTLGSVLAREGRPLEALELIDKALELKPGFIKAYYSRGVALARVGKTVEAIEDLSYYIQHHPGNARAYFNRGMALADMEQYDPAITDFSKTISLQGDDADAYYHRARLYNKKGVYDLAIADYNRVLELRPDRAVVYYYRANVHAGKGEHNQAISDLKRAIDLNPQFAEAYSNRGNAYAQTGDYNRARQDWQRVIDLAPESPAGQAARRNLLRIEKMGK